LAASSFISGSPEISPGRKQKPDVGLAGLTPAQADKVKKLASERAEQEARITELGQAPTIYGGPSQPCLRPPSVAAR